MNPSRVRRASVWSLTLLTATALAACDVRPGSKWSYSGSYLTCEPLVGSLVDFEPLYTVQFDHPVEVGNGDGKYQIKFKTMRPYQPDLPTLVEMRYRQFRPDGDGGFDPVGPAYSMDLECNRRGKCKSKANFTGFSALEGDILQFDWRLGDNVFGSPSFVRADTRVDFKYKIKFEKTF